MDFLIGAVGLAILIIIGFRQSSKRDKHELYLKHSQKYHDKYKYDEDLREEVYKKGGGKNYKKAIKEIEKDQREMAYIKDSIKEEDLKRAEKTMKLKHANELAYRYLDLIRKIWPTRGDHKHIPKELIINSIKELYPKVQDPEAVLEELTEGGVLAEWFNEKEYGILLDRVYHPTERDEKGYRILILNRTVFVRPQETF